MEIAIIAAVAANGVIGYRGAVPWRLPEDMQRFKDMTTGQAVGVGRATYESLSVKPLPHRANIVLSRNPNYQAPGCYVRQDFGEMVRWAMSEGRNLFVAGGTEVYRAALSYADAMYITRVDLEPKGDAFFPDYDESQWELVSAVPRCDLKSTIAYSFEEYRKRR